MNFNMEFYENSYRLIDASYQGSEVINGNWLKKFRKEAFGEAHRLGIPDRKIESWKYTNLQKLTKDMTFPVDLDHPLTLKELPVEINKIVKVSDIGLVFFNGHWMEALSWGDFKEHLLVQPLGSFLQGKTEGVFGLAGEEVRGWLETLEDIDLSRHDSAVFAKLNSALATDGYLIRVSPKASLVGAIQIVNIYGDRGSSDRAQRNLLIVGDHAKAAVVESHWGLSGVRCLTNTVTDLFLGIGAQLEYLRAYADSGNNFHYGLIRGQLFKNARLNMCNLNSGGAIGRNEIHISLEGEGAEVCANGLALLAGEQHLDVRTTIRHLEPHTMSRQLYKGVLNDSARNVFNGKIFIGSKAQKVDSSQLNKNLLLGDSAEADTKPELEVYADDVKATHGATVGQMNEEELFYLISRGIDRETATAMLARAFIEDVILKMSDSSIILQMRKIIDLNFDNFLEAMKARISEGEDIEI